MKKDKFGKIKIQRVDPGQLNERLLLINLYITQGLTLIIGIIILFFRSEACFHCSNFRKIIDFCYGAVDWPQRCLVSISCYRGS